MKNLNRPDWNQHNLLNQPDPAAIDTKSLEKPTTEPDTPSIAPQTGEIVADEITSKGETNDA